jgi:hypothetical protein
MKSTVIIILFLVNLSSGYCYELLKPDTYELKTSEATLVIDKYMALRIIHNKDECILSEIPLDNLWKITVVNKAINKSYRINNKDYSIEKTKNKIRIYFDHFKISDSILPVNVEFIISVKDDAFCFSGNADTYSNEWIFHNIEYPILEKIQFTKKDINIYWPEWMGAFYNNPVRFGNRSLIYPAARGASMPWYLLRSQNNCFYLGIHDNLQGAKYINLAYDEDNQYFNTFINFPVHSNEFSIPEVMVMPYSGDWYFASKFYRSWYNQYFKVAESPAWVKKDNGWLLAILKQQNGQVMWNYQDIDKLCDIAKEFNLSTIGLYGWAVGGHDNLYPYYKPDPLMGGREELTKAIANAQKKGIRIILYANGMIMDVSTDYYQYNGIETIILNDRNHPDIQFYVKYINSTPKILATACAGSGLWRETMLDIAIEVKSLGADGVMYDQVGVIPPNFCFSKYHDHDPGQSDINYRFNMIQEIRKEMKEIDPDFIIMNEATNDLIIREIDYTHGWRIGGVTYPPRNFFPELFRYTFPELIMTQRNPNPIITRTDANFAFLYGLRHEIESRYEPDVNYLLYGTKPNKEDYFNNPTSPNITKINEASLNESKAYTSMLINFQKQHADFFRYGKFIDEEGITLKGEDILAKGFSKDNKIGVVVWNTNLRESRPFNLKIQGYSFLNGYEPDHNGIFSSGTIDPNSIQLIVFVRD